MLQKNQFEGKKMKRLQIIIQKLANNFDPVRQQLGMSKAKGTGCCSDDYTNIWHGNGHVAESFSQFWWQLNQKFCRRAHYEHAWRYVNLNDKIKCAQKKLKFNTFWLL